MQVQMTFEPEFDELYASFVNDTKKAQYLNLDGIGSRKVDVGQMSHNYFTKNLADTSVDMNANANEELSANNYQAEVTKGVLKLEGYYLIWRYMKKRFGLERANEALTAIWDGSLYFHDASGHGVQVPYCFAFSTSSIMLDGRPYGQLHSLPPKRSDSFIAQVIEVCMDMSQEFAGAVAPSDLIVNYCYYSKKELNELLALVSDLRAVIEPEKNQGHWFLIMRVIAHFFGIDLSDKKAHDKFFKTAFKIGFGDVDTLLTRFHYKKMLNDFQKFVHVMNNKFRVSGQSPFTNVSIFDRPNLMKLFEHVPYLDGSNIDIEYVMTVQKLVAGWFAKGDPKTGLPYRFPVMTCNVSIDENNEPLDDDFVKFIAEANTDLGVFNIYGSEGSKIAMCCRYVNDMERMKYRSDSFGNGGLNIGAHRIVLIDNPKIALEAGTEEKFFEILGTRLELAKDLLLVHREEILRRRVERGFLKFFKPLQWLNLDMFFSTIGLTGIYETCHYLGMPIESEAGQKFVERLLTTYEAYADKFSEETKHSFNVEEVPGESAVITLAKKDKITFGDKQVFELYSNQYLPLIADVPLADRVDLTGKFMNMVSGGGIFHMNIQDKIPTAEKMEKIIRMLLKKGIIHFAVNYGFGICENGHTTIVGNQPVCPICGAPIKDYYTRIIGYFTKTSSWNEVRRNYDFPQRKFA